MGSRQLTEFIILDIEPIGEPTGEKTQLAEAQVRIQKERLKQGDRQGGRRRVIASMCCCAQLRERRAISGLTAAPLIWPTPLAAAYVQVARVCDFGKNDTVIFTKTHLGSVLKAGDMAWGCAPAGLILYALNSGF